MTDLLPCPFCGYGQSMVDPWFDDMSKRWAIGCGRCGASSGRSVHAEGSKEAAIKSWNTRNGHLNGEPQEVPQRDPMLAAVASLAAAISLLERTPRAKKAAPSDKMFDQMLADYRKALANARDALALSRPEGK